MDEKEEARAERQKQHGFNQFLRRQSQLQEPAKAAKGSIADAFATEQKGHHDSEAGAAQYAGLDRAALSAFLKDAE